MKYNLEQVHIEHIFCFSKSSGFQFILTERLKLLFVHRIAPFHISTRKL